MNIKKSRMSQIIFSDLLLLVVVLQMNAHSIATGDDGTHDWIHHVIAADEHGLSMDLQSDQRYSPQGFEEAVNNMFNRAERLAKLKAEEAVGDQWTGRMPVKILVHVHGGLNNLSHTEERAKTLAPVIMNEAVDWYYPIFLSWPSSFGSTYPEHLFSVRNGNKVGPYGKATFPLVLGMDLVQSLARMPLDLYYQGVNFKDRAFSRTRFQSMLSRSWKIAEERRSGIDRETLRWSRYYRSDGSRRQMFLDVVQIPVRATLGTLYQGTIAQASWNNMKRRTTNIVDPSPLFEMRDDRLDPNEIKAMAAGHFFQLMVNRAREYKSSYDYEIYLVGHSMGAIVLNKVLTRYRQEWIESESLRRIVFMGAASTIGDTHDSIVPLLREYNQDEVKLIFHNLTLNRVAEIAERSAFGWVPAGSLLENIDQHLEAPESPTGRTMGSELNLLAAIDLFQEVAAYSQFKAFDAEHNFLPRTHGDFSRSPFWLTSFWMVNTVTGYKWDGEEVNYYPVNWLADHPANEPFLNKQGKHSEGHDRKYIRPPMRQKFSRSFR